jgi:hypothetical protein
VGGVLRELYRLETDITTILVDISIREEMVFGDTNRPHLPTKLLKLLKPLPLEQLIHIQLNRHVLIDLLNPRQPRILLNLKLRDIVIAAAHFDVFPG